MKKCKAENNINYAENEAVFMETQSNNSVKNYLVNKNDNSNIAKNTTRKVVLIGMLSATLTAGKLALSFIPNVEIITILIMVYSTVFERKIAVFSSLVFCTIEVLLYGFNSWVILYFIHWNALALLSGTLLKKPRIIVAVLLSVIMTFAFGVLDSIIYTVMAAAGGVPNYQLLNLLIAYYLRGGWFYLVHIVSNACVVGALYIPLVLALQKVRPK